MAEPGSQDGVEIASGGTGQDELEEAGGGFHEQDFYGAGADRALLQVGANPLRGMSSVFYCRVNNLAYFRLDFLDKDRVSLRRAFREILPLLWLKAGAIGPRPELPKTVPEPAIFAPEGNNFAVLLEESRVRRFTAALMSRTDLTQIFIVTDADESFKSMAAELQETIGISNPGMQVTQLYRDYLVNFMINKQQDLAAAEGVGA